MKQIYTTIALLFGLLNFAQQGELDTTFGSNGILNFTNLINPNKMIFQPDGKILLLGNMPNLFAKIIRFNLDGTLDQTFGNSGIADVQDGPGKSIDLQSNGKIVISAGQTAYRFNNDGTADLTFNNNSGFTNDVAFLKVQPDQSILTLNQANNSFRLVGKMSANGVPDATYNGGNPAYINAQNNLAIGINILDNGKIVFSTSNYLQQRRNANGTFDIDYDGGNPDQVRDAKTINNSLFISCRNGATGATNYSIFKYNLAGNLDTSYSTDGITETNFNGNLINIPYGINVQTSGKIILVGKTGDTNGSSIGLARFNTNGTLDTTFGTNGKTITPINTLTNIGTVSAISPTDDKLYVISRNNTISNLNSQDIIIARYTTGSNLSSNEFLQNSKFKISPNPTNSVLTIQIQEKINSINIIDFLGRKTNITNFENNTIDVSNLQNGVYFLEIATENGSQVQKIIKN